MAKKGGIQQLQAEINDDEELEKFLERPGLLVIDIYSDWCGPCLGMVSALRKIKLEIGGDNLQLAVAKSDNIKAFERFQRKSEPTWLFVVNGRAVNIAFGTNVPVLNKLIISELNQINAKNRPNFDVSDYQPVEIEMRKVIEEAKAAAEALELAEAKKARLDYLTFVTDSIMENLPDIGVTVFGPQVNRDMFKKIAEPAEALKIQCKDRKMTIITPENFETINYACQNPLHADVQEIMNEKEVMVCFWKLPEDQGQKLLFTYANDLTKTDQQKDEDTGRTIKVPPILTQLDLKVQVEWKEGDEWFEDEPDEPPPPPLAAESSASHIPVPDEEEKHIDEVAYEDGEEEYMGEEEGGAEPPPDEPMPLEPMPDFDFGLDLDLDGEEEEVEEENEEDVMKKRFRTKRIRVPPIWVPNNQRTHAALIYVLFRSQTTPFLPPDPVPEPPHIIMAFDSYKKKDLVSFADRHKSDIPLYGFFTTDDASEAQLIANTAEKYMSASKTQSDKLVLKVNKQTSHTMLTLATYNPSYVSPNTIIGAEEALKFFPPDYVTGSQEALAETAEGSGDKKKKKKKRSSKTAAPDAGGDDDTPREGDEGEGAGDGEGAGEGDAGEGGEGADGEGGEAGEGDHGEGGEAGSGEGGEGAGEGHGEGEGDHGEGGEAGSGEGAGEGAGGEDGEAAHEGGAAEDAHEGEAGGAEGASDAAAAEKEAETAAEAPEAASEAPATPPEAAAAPEAPEDGPATPPSPATAEPAGDGEDEG